MLEIRLLKDGKIKAAHDKATLAPDETLAGFMKRSRDHGTLPRGVRVRADKDARAADLAAIVETARSYGVLGLQIVAKEFGRSPSDERRWAEIPFTVAHPVMLYGPYEGMRPEGVMTSTMKGSEIRMWYLKGLEITGLKENDEPKAVQVVEPEWRLAGTCTLQNYGSEDILRFQEQFMKECGRWHQRSDVVFVIIPDARATVQDLVALLDQARLLGIRGVFVAGERVTAH